MDENSLIPLSNHDGKRLTKEETAARLKEISQNGGWRQLKRDIIKYNEMRDDIIKEMENHPDPVFNRYLKIYKNKLSPRDYEHNRLKIYAICNKHAMYNCLSVDEMVNVIINGRTFP